MRGRTCGTAGGAGESAGASETFAPSHHGDGGVSRGSISSESRLDAEEVVLC